MRNSAVSKFSLVSALVLGSAVSSVALGDGAAATGPAPIVATGQPTPPPPPAAAPAAPVVRPAPRIEVFEFAPVDKSAAPADWIGKGIRENLQSDVSRTGATLILPAHPPAAGEDAITAARQEHADLAVTGTYQIVGDQIRVNAHLIDVATDTAAGGFSATGSQRDLFQVEDALGEQFRRLLPRPVTAATGQTQEAQTAQQEQPQVVLPPPAVVYQEAPTQAYAPAPVVTYEPDFYYPGYGYDDGYYGGIYPFGFYGGIGIYGGAYRGAYYGNHGGGFRGGVSAFHGGGGHVGGGFHGGGFHGGGGGGRR